jgi:hypothetical protein
VTDFHPLRTFAVSATMQLVRTALGVMLIVGWGGCLAAQPSATDRQRAAVPVEVWTGGDDGLTRRLADAVRDEFKQSALFALTPASTPNSLRVSIPTNVEWEQVGGRTRVAYKLRLARGDRTFGVTAGVCWENDLRTCARQVVEEATNSIGQ